jgi:hypothetical protein
VGAEAELLGHRVDGMRFPGKCGSGRGDAASAMASFEL